MGIQILFVALFALNLALLWLTILSNKADWYRRAGYPLLVLIPLLTVFFDQPRFELDHFWWRVAGVLAILLGLALNWWAKRELAKLGVAWQGSDPERLVRTGPYQYLRHPIYLALVFIIVGWWWIAAAVYSFYFGMFMLGMIWIHGHLEDKFILEKKFKQDFVEYRGRTGMFWVK
jgi:protein-S-isoprenylcysteine O-methyltransferase Ste14